MLKHLIICATFLLTTLTHAAEVVEPKQTITIVINDPSLFYKLPEKEKASIIKSFGNQKDDAIFLKVHKLEAQTYTYMPYSTIEEIMPSQACRDAVGEMTCKSIAEQTCVIM